MRGMTPSDELENWETISYECHVDDGDDRYAVERMLVGQADVVRYRPADGAIGGVLDRWTYRSYRAATNALHVFMTSHEHEQDEPEGWHRHRPSNRRRPDGDPEREEVRP